MPTLLRPAATFSEPAAVNEIDIGVAALEKQRGVARGLALEAMAARIAQEVSLGLDDPSAHPPALVLPHERLPDQPARQASRRHRQFRSRERTYVYGDAHVPPHPEERRQGASRRLKLAIAKAIVRDGHDLRNGRFRGEKFGRMSEDRIRVFWLYNVVDRFEAA